MFCVKPPGCGRPSQHLQEVNTHVIELKPVVSCEFGSQFTPMCPEGHGCYPETERRICTV